MPDKSTPRTWFGLTPGQWLKKILVAAATFFLLGWFYGWASPWAYPKDRPLGAAHGVLHGAMMPMALPSLVLGQDAEIFASNNSGRPYKIGYIAGINVCGFVVFGSLFWKPKRKLPTGPRTS